MELRVGNGVDVHQLVDGRACIIGGVQIPYQKGLLGHSDADVLIHSLIDALLGACGLGVIGEHFPDTDLSYAGISSLILLERCCSKMIGFRLVNADVTVIAQAPKLAPYFEKMKVKIADAIGCSVDRINIKATTTEHLGFAGRGEGIASVATVLVEKEI